MKLKVAITVSALLLGSSLSAAPEDLYCKTVPVTMFYAGYETAVGDTNYVYLNIDRNFLLNIIPPASYGESKQIINLTSYFPQLPKMQYTTMVFPSSVQGSSSQQAYQIASYLVGLQSVNVTMFYAAYKTGTDATNYVYYNTDRGFVLNIIPPANYGEKKQVQVITNDFADKPQIHYEKCTYDPVVDGYLDSNGNACKADYQVSLVFSNAPGATCATSSSSSSTPSSSSSSSTSSVPTSSSSSSSMSSSSSTGYYMVTSEYFNGVHVRAEAEGDLLDLYFCPNGNYKEVGSSTEENWTIYGTWSITNDGKLEIVTEDTSVVTFYSQPGANTQFSYLDLTSGESGSGTITSVESGITDDVCVPPSSSSSSQGSSSSASSSSSSSSSSSTGGLPTPPNPPSTGDLTTPPSPGV